MNTESQATIAGGRADAHLSDALTQLRLKLLDLTGRNRLINFKHAPGRSLQFVNGTIPETFRKLVEDGQKIDILGLFEPRKDDWVDRNGRLQRPEPKEWAKEQGISTSFDLVEDATQSDLRALMYRDDLAKHCRKIEREAALAIEETGANMLFLVIGFLEFPDQRDSDRIFSAPLVCVPVTLLKKEVGGIESFSLQYTDEEIADNLSLSEKLRNDFGFIFPEFGDEASNVEYYLNQIAKIVKANPRFAVKRRVSLCLLSFSSMLMVRDLDPSNWPSTGEFNELLDHPIVRKVFEGHGTDPDSSYQIAEEHAVEDEPGASIPLIYDADSSQHSALVDVISLKKNMVIEGPPGTGKSQTITNLIAACLYEGKKVLFVAEKLAALEVVKARLSQAGLDPFVLELHSNKTNKKKVLQSINDRLEYEVLNSSELPSLLSQLEAHRAELKTYSDIMNSVSNNSFGLTLHQVMWRAERYRSALIVESSYLGSVRVDDADVISEFELSRRVDCLSYLANQFAEIGGFGRDKPFWGFYPDRLVPGDEVRIEKLLVEYSNVAEKFSRDAKTLEEFVGNEIVSGMSREMALAKSKALMEMAMQVSPDLPFHLMPAMFAESDIEGKANQSLEAFASSVRRFSELGSTVLAGLKSEEAATGEFVQQLTALSRQSAALGMELGDWEALEVLSRTLNETSEKLAAALDSIKDRCGARGIIFDCSRDALDRLIGVSKVIAAAPDEHLDFQSPALARDNALPLLEALSVVQAKMVHAWKKLSVDFYLDTLPEATEIKQAVSIFREGDTWYRIFQGRWRSAKRLHHSLLRAKTQQSGAQRLSDLEEILDMLHLQERWSRDSAWQQVLNRVPPNEPESLDAYLAIARWNKAVKVAGSEIGVTLIEPERASPEMVRTMRRDFAATSADVVIAREALHALDASMPKLREFAHFKFINRAILSVRELLVNIDRQIPMLRKYSASRASVAQILSSCKASVERAELRELIEKNAVARRLMGDRFAGVNSDVLPVLQTLSFGKSFDSLGLSDSMKKRLRSADARESCKFAAQLLSELATGVERLGAFDNEMKKFGAFNFQEWVGAQIENDIGHFGRTILGRIISGISNTFQLVPWSLYVARRIESLELPLDEFVKMLEEKYLVPGELASAYGYCVHATIVRYAFKNVPQLGRFAGLKHNQIRKEFNQLDKDIIRLRGRAVGKACHGNARPPRGQNGIRVGDKTEMMLLAHLLPQQRPRIPVRKMIQRAGRSIQSLKPCFMMGPQAVAQYLTPGAVKFDLVIMDEASQLKPEEAIGAVARGGQLVVVGDPNQLPPTSFFSRQAQVSDEEEQYSTTDAESILDVCSSHFRPVRSLRWHYRSQHHSLIAFSNKHFYKSNLIIFPSPFGQGGRLGVRATYLADAIYENQTNLREANRVVAAVVEHIRTRPEDSVGVATLNVKQRDLIAELLDNKLRDIPEANEYRERWKADGQSLFVKNLENVQGDERDAIIVSTTFGRPPGAAAVRQNFGPISRQGGWRRLNVLFTRAKKSISIYTSLRPEDIVLEGNTPEGTRALRHYLEYARTGLLTNAEDTGLEPDSDFEVSVLNMLQSQGYETTPQLGVAGYRIDIAVKHPDSPGSYLAAIECDGASYHSAQSVRDRDRIRQEILESMGWRGRIWRIWSTDWFRTPKQESEKLLGFLHDLRRTWKPEHSSGASWIEEGVNTESVTSAQVDQAPPLSFGQQQISDIERQEVSEALVDGGEYVEIKVGDLVKYSDISKPSEILVVQITASTDDFPNGLVSQGRPLAQAMLGAVVGDEVQLNLPGISPRMFRILDISRQ